MTLTTRPSDPSPKRIRPRTWVSRSVAVAVVAGLLLAAGAAAPAETGGGGGPNNVVVVVNTKDGSTKTKSSSQVAHDMTDVVDNGNAAVAESSCTGCRTVAVAVQIVLVERNANVVTPANLAMALNVNCTDCQTMAAAYQDVVSTGGPVHFTQQGEQDMNDIRAQIRDLVDSPLSLWDLKAQLDAEVQQLWGVVDTELVHVGNPFSDERHKKVDIDTSPGGADCSSSPAPSPDPSSTQDTGASPAGDTQPAPTVTPCPDVSASPDAGTATPTPAAAAPTPCPTPTPSPSESPSPSPSPTESPT